MQNDAVWVSIEENLEKNALYITLLNLVKNKEELQSLLNNSHCSGSCTGNCSHIK